VPYKVAGKTGTAQVIGIKQNEKYNASKIDERHRDHSLFMAFAPADKPAIALALLVENGGFGSMAAAPIARIAFDQYLLGKAPAGAVPREPDEAPPAARVIAQASNAASAATAPPARTVAGSTQ